MEKLIKLIINRPKTLLFFTILFSLLISTGTSKLVPNFTYRVWYSDNHPMIVDYDNFEQLFGNDDSIGLLVHNPKGIFNAETISLLRELEDGLWQVQGVSRVDSLLNFNWISAQNDQINVQPLIPYGAKLTDDLLKTRTQWIHSDPLLKGYLINEDLTSTLLFAPLIRSNNGELDFTKVVLQTRALVSKYLENVSEKIYVIGSASLTYAFQESATKDFQFIFPMLSLIVVIFFIALYKRAASAVLPFVVIILSTTVAFGIGGFLNFSINNLTATLPQIMITIGIADTIHLLTAFIRARVDETDVKIAMQNALSTELKPIFLTSLTTAIGFGSVGTASVVPIKQVGILAASGVAVAFLITIGVLAPLLVLFPNLFTTPKSSGSKSLSKEFILKYVNWLQTNRNILVAVYALITFTAGFYLIKNFEINSDPINYFSKEVPARKSADFTLSQFKNGAPVLEIFLDSGAPDGIKSPEFMQKVDQLDQWLKQEQPKISTTFSLLDILKKLNKTLNNDVPGSFKIADSQNMIAQQLFLYNMSLPEGSDLSARMSSDYRYFRLNSNLGQRGSMYILDIIDQIDEKIKDIGLEGHVTGKMKIYTKLDPLILPTLFDSLKLVFVLIVLVISLSFRSVRLGLLSLLPNIIPVMIGGAALLIFGGSFNIGTTMVASACLGIAIDDTIHVISAFHDYQKQGLSSFDSIVRVFEKKTPALFFTTITLFVGFFSFIFASFYPNLIFGVLSASILAMALIVDLTLLPALLLTKPKT